jgi:hypothetical protein
MVNICPETNACWDMGDVHVSSTADVLCSSNTFQRNFQLFITQRCASLSNIPGFTRISWRAFSTPCCKISKSRIGSEYINVFRYSHIKESRGLGQGIVQANWLDLRVLPAVHRKLGSGAIWQRRENKMVPHHAWTTCAVVPRLLVNH